MTAAGATATCLMMPADANQRLARAAMVATAIAVRAAAAMVAAAAAVVIAAEAAYEHGQHQITDRMKTETQAKDVIVKAAANCSLMHEQLQMANRLRSQTRW